MTYASQADLVGRYGESMLVDLTDRAEPPAGEIDAGVVTRALEDTDAAINGYLLIMPNDEPETPLLGQMVEKLVAGTLTEHHLYERLVHFLEDWPEG